VCGRFVGFSNLEALQLYFPIDRVEVEVAPNYNLAPTQQVAAILREGGANVLRGLQWGLVPFWAQDPSMGSRLINARAETVRTKPAFRAAFRKRRCLIPADGFYEWKGTGSPKQPMFITLPDHTPFAFAGLWEAWDARGQAAQPLLTCTILTTEASPSLRDIHQRMPVILKTEAYGDWLDPEQPESELEGLLRNTRHTEFVARQVSRAVNSVRNNSAALIAEA
jgi:putative SOS response-associated peptidase YedK